MGNNWLDSHARRSAARRQGPQLGMNRRQVLVRGTAVAGGAWAASSLVSAPAYAFGVSGCTAANTCGTNVSEQQVCCANAFQCTSTPGAASNTCVTTDNAPGGNCGSSIGGACTGGTTCSSPPAALGQCGGQGATCQGNDVCGPGFAEANGNGQVAGAAGCATPRTPARVAPRATSPQRQCICLDLCRLRL